MAPRAMVTALLGLFAVFSSVATAKSNVIILTNDNFEHLTQASTGATTGDWLVEFYAPWCGHCKKLEPVYEKVADELKGKVNVAKVDATAHSALGKRFEIQGYPTILLLRQGTVYKYSGPRTTEELSRFARSGYKTLVGHPVPTPSSLLKTVKHHVQLIQQDFVSLMATKKNVLLVTFSGGLLVGVVLGWFCSCCSSRGSSASKKKSKTS
ncbi:hypothetical protein Poli38472_003132 [Pythium oligandrum]|uniref:Thioredoxin domain-containing protein n=1 Tax=Pythium oligandrum TaxID=41045 RepID=A0A8K1C713_PYTOL|nr:hypothetical protein Poli38472_003132 [Pythium oligandrum]|eukprot:TMW57207.1 hypothetical protein Poli38472_003132 [Pythium oligandrum]